MLSKVQRSSEVIDTHGQSTLVKVHLKEEEKPLLQAQGSRRAIVPSPNSSLLSPSGQMIPVNPFPASRWGLCLWLENPKASVVGGLFSLPFPGAKDKCSCLHLAATVVKKKDSSLRNIASALWSVSFPSRTAPSHLEAESQHLRENLLTFCWMEGSSSCWQRPGLEIRRPEPP